MLVLELQLVICHCPHDIAPNFLQESDNWFPSVLEHLGIEHLTSVGIDVITLHRLTEMSFGPSFFGPFVQVCPSPLTLGLTCCQSCIELSHCSKPCTFPYSIL